MVQGRSARWFSGAVVQWVQSNVAASERQQIINPAEQGRDREAGKDRDCTGRRIRRITPAGAGRTGQLRAPAPPLLNFCWGACSPWRGDRRKLRLRLGRCQSIY